MGVVNTTFNNISDIAWQSVLLVEKIKENHQPVAYQFACFYNILIGYWNVF
jgi:hypothetical protein